MALTSFFRDRDTLEAITDQAIPAIRHRPIIRVWDAGCATGEEAYTLAFIFAETLTESEAPKVRIDATDCEESRFPQFEGRIRDGIYNKNDVFWVPGELREKYFNLTDSPDDFQVIPYIRSMVRYQRHDLRSLKPIGHDFQLIVCKNVLLHLTEDERIHVVQMFHEALGAGGYLAFEASQDLPLETRHLFTPAGRSGGLFRKVESCAYTS